MKCFLTGYTKGVFQCEATPYTNLLVKMGVKNLMNLAASNALVRPGAMNTIGKDYIARKHGKQNVSYIHQVMKEFTDDTYGCIYTRNKLCRLAFTLVVCQCLMQTKFVKLLERKRMLKSLIFIKSVLLLVLLPILAPNQALDLWHDFEAHAGYSFNKSHAVAYSTLSYWTAWLKYYYPLEFMFALLKNEKDKDGRTEYLIEAKRMGISVKLPHINDSDLILKLKVKEFVWFNWH
jgi:DNA polymerase III subunit alpha